MERILADWEKKVLDIIGRESPLAEGLSVAESMQNDSPMMECVMVESIETSQQFESVNPELVLGSGSAGDREALLNRSFDENEDLDPSALKKAMADYTLLLSKKTHKKRKLSTKEVKETKEEFELKLMQGRIVKQNLEIEQLALQNYEKKLILLEMEQKMNLPNKYPVDCEIVICD